MSSDEIEGHVREKQNTERNIRIVKQDVVRLNLLIHKEKNMETDLESINILTEKEFVRALKVQAVPGWEGERKREREREA